MRDKTIG